MKKFTFIFFAVFTLVTATAQEAAPNLNITVVTSESVKTIAKESDKAKTLFFSFGVWCEPCRLHLPNAVKLAKEHNLNFYVLLVDAMDSDKMRDAGAYLHKLYPDVKIAVLDDAVYGKRTGKRNKKFVSEITPANLENIDDYSKYILLNSEGEVLMVTTYKDNEGNDWRDDSKMVEEKIVPLLR